MFIQDFTDGQIMTKPLLKLFLVFTSLAIPMQSKAAPDVKSDLGHMTTQVLQKMKMYPQNLGTKPWDYKTAGKDLSCQVGSLTKLLMQLEGERYRHGKTDPQIKEEIADELADILSLVLFISHELNIDITEAWNGMLESDKKKFKTRSQ